MNFILWIKIREEERLNSWSKEVILLNVRAKILMPLPSDSIRIFYYSFYSSMFQFAWIWLNKVHKLNLKESLNFMILVMENVMNVIISFMF